MQERRSKRQFDGAHATTSRPPLPTRQGCHQCNKHIRTDRSGTWAELALGIVPLGVTSSSPLPAGPMQTVR